MLLRTFNAHDMPTAMQMVRDTLGDKAIILSSQSSKGKKGVTITAAIDPGEDEDLPPAKTVLKPKETPIDPAAADRLRHDINGVLRFHNIPDLFVSKMTRHCSDKELSAMIELQKKSAHSDDKHLLSLAIEKLTSTYFDFVPINFDAPKIRLMLVGAPGIGKTLAVAKMAARISLASKVPNLTVITTDNKRAGGVEQLQAFTNILGVKLDVVASPRDLHRYIDSLAPSMNILIDTAGCNPYSHDEMKELKALTSHKTVEPILVMPAGGDSLEAIDMVENFMHMPVKRMMITRADTTRRFGGVLSVAAAHGLAFCNMSHSSSIVDTLQPVNGAVLSQLLLKFRNN